MLDEHLLADAATRSKRPVGYVAPDPIHSPLYVITPIYNPLRWKARWKHYERFAKHVADAGAVLYTVETAFGERDHAVSHAARDGWRAKCDFTDQMIHEHRWITLRTNQELWLKEAAINAGVRHLPHDWKYVAWLDGDVMFSRPNWVGECIHQLQHYKFLQMFSQAQDLAPDYTVISTRPSFMEAYEQGTLLQTTPTYYGGSKQKWLGAWSGLAWACTRDAWNHVGGLMDFAITGAGDWYMAWALLGQVQRFIPGGSHPNFVRRIMRWQQLAEQHIRRDVGVMSGTVQHMFHGRKSDRKYIDRSKMLAQLNFDPDTELKFDWQGLPILCDNGTDDFIKLRDGIRKWARNRNEDVTEV